MKSIVTENAPKAIGPYSQGKALQGLIFTSGQLPINPENGDIPEGIVAQAHQSIKNLKAVIEAGGGKMENVVKTLCFLSNMEDFAKFNEVYAEYFPTNPARSCVAVKTIPKNCLVELEAICTIE